MVSRWTIYVFCNEKVYSLSADARLILVMSNESFITSWFWNVICYKEPCRKNLENYNSILSHITWFSKPMCLTVHPSSNLIDKRNFRVSFLVIVNFVNFMYLLGCRSSYMDTLIVIWLHKNWYKLSYIQFLVK